jgi:glycerol kinase
MVDVCLSLLSVDYSHHTGLMMPKGPYVSCPQAIYLQNQYLTNCSVGITQYTLKGHIARATLEATCFQTKAILDAMEQDSGHTLSELAVDGGMSNSDLAMQVRMAFQGIFLSTNN